MRSVIQRDAGLLRVSRLEKTNSHREWAVQRDEIKEKKKSIHTKGRMLLR